MTTIKFTRADPGQEITLANIEDWNLKTLEENPLMKMIAETAARAALEAILVTFDREVNDEHTQIYWTGDDGPLSFEMVIPISEWSGQLAYKFSMDGVFDDALMALEDAVRDNDEKAVAKVTAFAEAINVYVDRIRKITRERG